MNEVMEVKCSQMRYVTFRYRIRHSPSDQAPKKKPSSHIIMKLCRLIRTHVLFAARKIDMYDKSALRFRQRPKSSQPFRPIEYHCNQQQEPNIVVERSSQPREGLDTNWIEYLPTDLMTSLAPPTQSLQFSTGKHNSTHHHGPIPLDNIN